MEIKNTIIAHVATGLILLGAVSLGYPTSARAQDDTSESEADSESASAPESTPEPPATATEAHASTEMTVLRQRLSELEQKSESDTQKIEELTVRLDMQEENAVLAETEKEMKLRVSGFMDVQFSKLFIKKNTFYDGYLPDSSTFTLGHWNLSLNKSLNGRFSMRGEVRLLFQPMGEESDWVGFERSEYSRFDTRATDVVDNHFFNWGGISIQRAYIQYELNDYFGARVGYYLTPFGIWNEEHGSPVILFAHRPFLSTSGNLPEAQLGMYLFGKAYAGDNTAIQYGVTVSNGRGPTAEVYDLDENKALGLTLQLTYEGAIFFNTGTYLYMGDYTDTTRSMELPAVHFSETTTIAYEEKAMSLHMQFKWNGIRLQGEYVRRLIEYDEGKRESADHGRGLLFTPDHVRNGSYELLAYTLPFDQLTLTPYVLHEWKDMPSWVEYWAGHSYGAGINWQIIPSVVLKVEGLINKHRKEQGLNSDFKMIIAQLACSY